MRWVGFVVCCIAACAGNAAEIYRCSGAGGEVLFTDVSCPAGHPQTTQPINSVDLALPDIVPLHRAADTANPRNQRPQGKRARDEKSREVDAREEKLGEASRERDLRGSASNSIEAGERRCAAARDRLDAVRATMRRGYGAASAGRMQTRLQDARARVERDCVR